VNHCVRRKQVSPEEYRKKANQADLAVSRISDPDLRSAYEKLATSWRHLAHDVEMAERAQGLPARPGNKSLLKAISGRLRP
jgi:hypothetical protein